MTAARRGPRSRPLPAARPLPDVDLSDWSPALRRPLRGRVAVVAGGTRGAGRAIAVCLGAAGATVYVTGRSVRGHPATPGRPETIDETAAMIRARGGDAVPVRVDHSVEPEVRRLFDRVRREQHRRLDILVNDIWGGERLAEWGAPPWKFDWRRGRAMFERAVYTHIVTTRYGVPLMVRRRRGLVVEVTDGAHFGYRGNYLYDLVKTTVIRLAFALSEEFRAAGLRHATSLAVTPGFLRSEEMLEQFGVSESNWKDAIPKSRHWFASETPYLLGKGVAELAADPRVQARAGQVVGSWELAKRYRYRDVDGARPDWGKVFAKMGK